jgi:hypothetical protein
MALICDFLFSVNLSFKEAHSCIKKGNIEKFKVCQITSKLKSTQGPNYVMKIPKHGHPAII